MDSTLPATFAACLIPLNVRKVPSNHPCKIETKEHPSFILFLALPPTHITELPQSNLRIPSNESQNPKIPTRSEGPPAGWNNISIVGKGRSKTSGLNGNNKKAHVLPRKQAQKFGIPSVFSSWLRFDFLVFVAEPNPFTMIQFTIFPTSPRNQLK